MRTITLILAAALAAQGRHLLVVSVDGLDQRYLSSCDALQLKIPNLRRLIREGQWSKGVIGVVPTVTWPSHTTMISGVDPAVHGILGNRRPEGDYYWSASLLKARTLLDAMHAAGRTTAAITWPVTVDAPVTYNLPEYFQKRRGGDMDTRSVESKSTPPDLVARISAMFPSFPQQWMEDRTRTLAAVYLLKTVKPELTLVHLVDLDGAAHESGPFSREANAAVEHIDDLIGDMLRALPKDDVFVLVSDHGFEKVDDEVSVAIDGVRTRGAIAIADTVAAAETLRTAPGVGREIPKDEVARFAPDLAKAEAVFESAAGVMFRNKSETHSQPAEAGNHGHWPMRYRAVFVAWGPGIKAERLPEFSQMEIAPRLAALLGITFTPGPK